MHIQAIDLFVAISANWRLSSLLANEGGPFDVFAKIRRAAENLDNRSKLFHVSKISKGLQCEWCNSLWISSVIALHFTRDTVEWLLLALALSTGTIVLKYVVQTLEQIRAYFEYAARLKKNEGRYSALFNAHIEE